MGYVWISWWENCFHFCLRIMRCNQFKVWSNKFPNKLENACPYHHLQMKMCLIWPWFVHGLHLHENQCHQGSQPKWTMIGALDKNWSITVDQPVRWISLDKLVGGLLPFLFENHGVQPIQRCGATSFPTSLKMLVHIITCKWRCAWYDLDLFMACICMKTSVIKEANPNEPWLEL